MDSSGSSALLEVLHRQLEVLEDVHRSQTTNIELQRSLIQLMKDDPRYHATREYETSRGENRPSLSQDAQTNLPGVVGSELSDDSDGAMKQKGSPEARSSGAQKKEISVVPTSGQSSRETVSWWQMCKVSFFHVRDSFLPHVISLEFSLAPLYAMCNEQAKDRVTGLMDTHQLYAMLMLTITLPHATTMKTPQTTLDAVQLFAVTLLATVNLNHVWYSTLAGDITRSIHANNIIAWSIANRVLFSVINVSFMCETWLLVFWVFTNACDLYSMTEAVSKSVKLCLLICGLAINLLFTFAFACIMNVASRSAVYSGALSETSVAASADRTEAELSTAIFAAGITGGQQDYRSIYQTRQDRKLDTAALSQTHNDAPRRILASGLKTR